jgi:hypothetical protein
VSEAGSRRDDLVAFQQAARKFWRVENCFVERKFAERPAAARAGLAGATRPDIRAAETKLPDDRFPAEELSKAGYRCVFSGQPRTTG